MSQWVIQTARLGLRPFLPKDAQSFYDLNADPEVIRYTGDPPFQSVAEATTFIESYDAYSKAGIGRWAAIDLQTNAFLGFCGLRRNSEGEVDLGFRFHRHLWGKGYATEASLACIDYAFNSLKLKSIIGNVAKENFASIRVLEKCGFRLEKDMPCESLPGWRYRLIN